MKPLQTLYLYIYFAWKTKDVGFAQQQTYEQVKLHPFVIQAVPVIIGATCLGTYIGDFRNHRLMREFNDRSNQ